MIQSKKNYNYSYKLINCKTTVVDCGGWGTKQQRNSVPVTALIPVYLNWSALVANNTRRILFASLTSTYKQHDIITLTIVFIFVLSSIFFLTIFADWLTPFMSSVCGPSFPIICLYVSIVRVIVVIDGLLQGKARHISIVSRFTVLPSHSNMCRVLSCFPLFVFLSIVWIQLQHICPDFKHYSEIFPCEILQIIL